MSKIDREDFLEKLSVKENEKMRLLSLQQKFSNGEITEEDINEDDIEKLHQLYDEQISELEKSTENYKRRILEIKEKLKKQE